MCKMVYWSTANICTAQYHLITKATFYPDVRNPNPCLSLSGTLKRLQEGVVFLNGHFGNLFTECIIWYSHQTLEGDKARLGGVILSSSNALQKLMKKGEKDFCYTLINYHEDELGKGTMVVLGYSI